MLGKKIARVLFAGEVVGVGCTCEESLSDLNFQMGWNAWMQLLVNIDVEENI